MACTFNEMFCFSSLLPSTVNTGLTVYRNKNSLSHFVIAGGKVFYSCSYFNHVWFRIYRIYESQLWNLLIDFTLYPFQYS